mmetsp:Transcript_17345/g.40431  ORF Transcript_17345/g.40431 Transcript_17345/m.40431 type:complete len:309 (+) Transcript_17345:121-1047(+)
MASFNPRSLMQRAFRKPESDETLSTELLIESPDRNRGSKRLWAREDLVELQTESGERIHAVHLQREWPRTILYSHGSGRNLGDILDDIEDMSEWLRADILAYEYLGFSTCDGKQPSEFGLLLSINAAYDYLTQQVDPSCIIAFGESLGAIPTIDLASRHSELGGMVLSAPWGVSASSNSASKQARVSMAAWNKMASTITRKRKDPKLSENKMPNVRCPVLFTHGTEDAMVPLSSSQRLLSKCQSKVHCNWLEGYSHDMVVGETRHNEVVLPVVLAFLNAVSTRRICKRHRLQPALGTACELKAARIWT